MSEPTERVIDEVLTRLDAVAEKIGEGADYFWPILVRQQYVEAAFVLLGAAALVGLAVLVFAGIRSVTRRDAWSEPTAENVAIIVGAVVLAVLTLPLLMVFDSVGAFVNPEYYALQDLLAMLK